MGCGRFRAARVHRELPHSLGYRSASAVAVRLGRQADETMRRIMNPGYGSETLFRAGGPLRRSLPYRITRIGRAARATCGMRGDRPKPVWVAARVHRRACRGIAPFGWTQPQTRPDWPRHNSSWLSSSTPTARAVRTGLEGGPGRPVGTITVSSRLPISDEARAPIYALMDARPTKASPGRSRASCAIANS
jgi:hypothetical protein